MIETVVYAHMDAEGFIVEHGGALRTGPFKSWERAVRWYERELDKELRPDEEQKQAGERLAS
jgi:hypothetical protein